MCMAIQWGADIGFMGQAADHFEDALASCHKAGYGPSWPGDAATAKVCISCGATYRLPIPST